MHWFLKVFNVKKSLLTRGLAADSLWPGWVGGVVVVAAVGFRPGRVGEVVAAGCRERG